MDRANVTALFGEDVERGSAVIGAQVGLAGAIGNAMTEHAELAAVFAGANVGLALFDRELRLLACNTLYCDLCGYRPSEIVAGAALTDLMRISLVRQNKPEDLIERTISLALGRLEPGSTYTFRYSTPSARTVEVIRRMLPSGAIVETVRELGAVQAATTDLNTQFEQIAEAARQRMMHALDVMADGFALFDAQDRLTAYNRKFVETKPRIADLIVPGLTYEKMLREAISRGQYVFQGMTEAQYLELRLVRHRNPGESFEVQLCDGRWIRVDEQRTVDGGIVGTRSDITEMKNREFDLLRISHQLHAKNQMFDTALNNMIQGLCMFDADRRLIVCNRRYLELYGFSAEVVRPGIELSEIMRYSVSLGNYTAEESARALAERPDPTKLKTRSVIKQRLKDGRIIAVLNEPMEGGGTIATYQDITEAERHEQRLHDYTQKLERSNKELENFAYVASHDLQEPLRKIEAFSDRLARKYGEQLPDEGKMFMERMQNAAQRMRRLINDLLDFSRVSTKTAPLVMTDLDRVLADVISDLQVRIEENSAEVVVGSIGSIEADATHMRQLLQNLIGNALKFRTPERAPRVTITAERRAMVEGLLDSATPALIISIADNGIGFDNKFKDQIFKIFQRLHGRQEYEGTGIGLATCRKIVDRHNGILDADGRPGEGATFTIVLPLEQPKAL